MQPTTYKYFDAEKLVTVGTQMLEMVASRYQDA